MTNTTDQNQSLTVIILAAGMGTRMKSSEPKVMHHIANQPMIQRVIASALTLKADRIITVIGPDMQQVAEAANAVIPEDCEHHIVVQKDRLGTGHAVKVALESLDTQYSGKLLVLYGDTPLIHAETLQEMLFSLDQDHINGAVVLGFIPEDAGKYGRLVVGEEKRLDAIIEYKDASEAERVIKLCNSGVMAFHADVVYNNINKINNQNASGEYYLTDMIDILVQQQKQSTYIEASEEEVMGINDKLQLSQAEAIVQNRLRERAMLNGVSMVAPETVFLSEDTRFGRDIIIHPHVVIGKGVSIADGVVIKSFTHIEKAEVHDNAAIGPYSRLRPGAVIGKRAGIGNFVEVKNSTIADEAKVGHLSYIGDAEIGYATNIGAGTITCNYDGYHKHKTIIGESAFIGSNTIFVAPVTVGNQTLTAAGSVITKDVETNALAVSRNPQRNYQEKAIDIRKKKMCD